MDWNVDRKVVSAGDPVRITYTNLDSDDDPEKKSKKTKSGKTPPGEFVLS